jgi:hypothetical protein
LLQTPTELPLTKAEDVQVRAALAAVEEARRRVAGAADTFWRIACATRDRYKNN